MNTNKCYFKQGVFILSYLLLLGVEAYFIKAVKLLYSPYSFLGTLIALGLILNFVFMFVFGKGTNKNLPFCIYQLIQAGLAFLISYFLFHITWKESLVYSAGALGAMLSFVLIRSELSLKNILLLFLLGMEFAISLRLSEVSGGLLFALAFLNSFYLGNALLESSEEQKSLWSNVVLFTSVLALGRAAIQYYLIKSGYDSLGVVITLPYSFAGLFAGFLLPLVYTQIIKDKKAGCVLTFLVAALFFPWVLGIFIHVRPFAAYLLGFVLSAFVAGILYSAPLGLTLVSYLNFASAVFGLTVFASLANLGRGIRLAILGGVFVVSLLTYIIQSLLQKNKS